MIVVAPPLQCGARGTSLSHEPGCPQGPLGPSEQLPLGLRGGEAFLGPFRDQVPLDLISERTREGLAKARSSGRKLGRPKGSLGVSRLNGKEDNIRRFLDLGVSKPAIAKLTGVSRTTLYSFMRTRELKPSP